MPEKKMSIEDVVIKVENEGLGYAVQSYFSGDEFADPVLSKKWKAAAKLLDDIESILSPHMP